MRLHLTILALCVLAPSVALAEDAPPAPYAMDTFPAKTLEMCAYTDTTIERPAAGGTWTYGGSSGSQEWVTCDQVPKGADGSAYANLLIGTEEEGWKLVQDPRPPTVQMHGLVPFHEKLLWAIGPKQKRATTDTCAEGKPATALVCEGMSDSPASDYVTWVRKMEAANRVAEYWIGKGDIPKARAALREAPSGEGLSLSGVEVTAKVKTSEKTETIAQFKQRAVDALKKTLDLYKRAPKPAP